MKDVGIAFCQRLFKMKVPQNTALHPDLRINSYGHYLRQRFGCRISKVNLDAGFTCPNRDGSKGVGGCIFCNNSSFSPRETIASIPLKEQLEAGMAYHRKRLGSQKFIAYFQKYTNTYAAVEQLEELYMEALSHPDVIGISVGTRPDCLTDQVVELLSRIAEKHYLCLELGLQSADDSILQQINRGHTLADFVNSVQRANGHGFDICGHLIYGFSDETPRDFLPTADLFNSLPGITSLKLHQLHVVEGTPLASLYRHGQFTPLQLDQYVNTAADFLERLHPRISIQRLYGSSPREILVAPRWGLKNNQLWYAVINELKRRNSWQGCRV
jgi:radical SAM protein (TIGR01212 family)